MHPGDLGRGRRDLALVAIKDPDWDAEAKANGVVRPDSLVLDLRCDVPPSVRACQSMFRPRALPIGFPPPRVPPCQSMSPPRALPIGFRRPQVGAIVERSPHENGLVQGDLREAELSPDCEFLGD